MKHWLALSLGLAIAAAALYLLASGERSPRAPAGPPQADIDDESRARLERVLEQADREEARR